MPGIARFGDLSTGHGFPSRPNDEASTSSFTNGLGRHRVSDHWVEHCQEGVCHDGHLQDGSAFLLTDGRKTGRIGDPIDCGDFVLTGSDTHFAG